MDGSGFCPMSQILAVYLWWMNINVWCYQNLGKRAKKVKRKKGVAPLNDAYIYNHFLYIFFLDKIQDIIVEKHHYRQGGCC